MPFLAPETSKSWPGKLNIAVHTEAGFFASSLNAGDLAWIMSLQATTPQRRAGIKAVFLEAALVAMIGCALAFAANAFSPRGLEITHNYFPVGTHAVSPAPRTVESSLEPGRAGLPVGPRAPPRVSIASMVPEQTSGPVETSDAAGRTNSSLAPRLISVPRLIDQGLQGIDYDQAVRFFKDPRRRKGLIVFIDARNDTHYQAGHVPGAYLFDPYHSAKYLAAVLPICQEAEQIVVYCVASECEDSELAAVLLRNAGIPNQKLFVYVGGFTEWTANRQPVETGTRNSGNIHDASE